MKTKPSNLKSLAVIAVSVIASPVCSTFASINSTASTYQTDCINSMTEEQLLNQLEQNLKTQPDLQPSLGCTSL